MSLGILVGRFGAFLRERPGTQQPASPGTPFPSELSRVREAFGHHLVPLMLLARCDGEAAIAERQVILRYCIERAQKAGLELASEEQSALSDYLCDFYPTRLQLDPALKRLEHDAKDHIAALIVAAQAVVDADGIRRRQEVLFLASLSRDLAAL
jgi:hypothetical protein